MALTRKTQATSNDAAEAADTVKPSNAERLAAAAAKHATELEEQAGAGDPAASTAAGTAVVAKASGAVVAKSAAMQNPLDGLKDAYPVNYDSVRNLVITNGNILDRQTNKALGDTVTMELMSFQDQWVVSPGVDGDEAKELVRYSDDGVTTTQGEDCKAYLQELKDANYVEAKMSQRIVLVGALVVAGKMPELEDSIVQINFPPSSRGAFQQYQVDQAFKINKGKVLAEGVQIIKVTCEVVTKGKNSWTVAHFSRAGA